MGPEGRRSERQPGSRALCRRRHPQYAFAALYEGDVGSKVHGGSDAAPMIGRILRGYGEQGDGTRSRAESSEDTDQNASQGVSIPKSEGPRER